MYQIYINNFLKSSTTTHAVTHPTIKTWATKNGIHHPHLLPAVVAVLKQATHPQHFLYMSRFYKTLPFQKMFPIWMQCCSTLINLSLYPKSFSPMWELPEHVRKEWLRAVLVGWWKWFGVSWSWVRRYSSIRSCRSWLDLVRGGIRTFFRSHSRWGWRKEADVLWYTDEFIFNFIE